jgi:hypothetical protein
MGFVDFVRSFSSEWWRITLLGEPTILIPVSIIVIVWLWFACGASVSLKWAALLAIGGGVLISQKLLYYVAGISFSSIKLYTMSGHSVAASYVYGSLIAIIAREWPRWLKYIGWLPTALLVISIGISRVAVAGHRSSEAISGLSLGTILLIVFVRYVWLAARARVTVWLLAVPVFVTIIATYGHVFEFENIFRWLGRWANPGSRFYR